MAAPIQVPKAVSRKPAPTAAPTAAPMMTSRPRPYQNGLGR